MYFEIIVDNSNVLIFKKKIELYTGKVHKSN